MKYTSGGYTLIEILAGVTIVTIVTLSGFYAINTVGIGKIKLIEKTHLEQQAFFFSERLFELIKSSGTLDYEEYFNRSVVGDTLYLSGHYDTPTGFGNRSTTMVYCLSKNGDSMGTSGCISDYNSTNIDITGTPLIFGQYAEQFIDYNSDADNDGGDEDSIDGFRGDDDDKFLGNGPSGISSDGSVSELYLINSTQTQRTYFRLFVTQDPDAPSTATCDFSTPKTPTGAGCLGTIQFLKLRGVDWGHDHDVSSVDATQNDGKIDTWIYDPDTYGLSSNIVADIGPIDSENYWLSIFADDIHVTSFEMFVHPGKDSNLAWADDSTGTFISPYMQLSMNLTPSWKNKGRIKGKIPEIQINTSINLTSNYN